MILNVDIGFDNEDVDLEALYKLSWVLDEADLAEGIMVHVAGLAIEHEVPFGEVEPDYIEDDNGNELSVSSNSGMYWVHEVAKFAWHVLHTSDGKDDWGKYFAYVDNEHWNQFDFDNMSDIDDYYQTTFDGDYKEYGRQRLDDFGEDLPSHLADYFDYAAYGEDLLEDENVCEWGYEKYVFSE
jgi:hypothetical protein